MSGVGFFLKYILNFIFNELKSKWSYRVANKILTLRIKFGLYILNILWNEKQKINQTNLKKKNHRGKKINFQFPDEVWKIRIDSKLIRLIFAREISNLTDVKPVAKKQIIIL